VVWDYTPRQAAAFVAIAEKRRRSERARYLELTAIAMRADSKDVNKRLRKDWNEE
jgi:hypothetical protein